MGPPGGGASLLRDQPKQCCTWDVGLGGSSLLLEHSHSADTSFLGSQADRRCPLWSAAIALL